jgi:hypothetical protein
MNVTTGKHGTQLVLTVGVYGALFVLGAVEGVIGSFQYSRTAGSVPLAAIAFCAGILVTCLLAAWGMRSASGALMPAAGWIIAAFVLSMPASNGSVIITDTTPGKWYLYGGTVSVLIGVAASFGSWIRTPPR